MYWQQIEHTHTHTLTHSVSVSLSHKHTHTYTLCLCLSLTHTHTHTLSLCLSHTNTHTHTHTHTHIYTLSLSHTNTHTHIVSLSLSLSHTNTHTHTHTNTYTNTLASQVSEKRTVFKENLKEPTEVAFQTETATWLSGETTRPWWLFSGTWIATVTWRTSRRKCWRRGWSRWTRWPLPAKSSRSPTSTRCLSPCPAGSDCASRTCAWGSISGRTWSRSLEVWLWVCSWALVWSLERVNSGVCFHGTEQWRVFFSSWKRLIVCFFEYPRWSEDSFTSVLLFFMRMRPTGESKIKCLPTSWTLTCDLVRVFFLILFCVCLFV